MYVCMSVCLYVCMSVCLYVCMSVCLYVCVSVCLCVCMSVCLYVCKYVCMYVGRYVCMYVCIHNYIHEQYVHIYIYVFVSFPVFLNLTVSIPCHSQTELAIGSTSLKPLSLIPTVYIRPLPSAPMCCSDRVPLFPPMYPSKLDGNGSKVYLTSSLKSIHWPRFEIFFCSHYGCGCAPPWSSLTDLLLGLTRGGFDGRMFVWLVDYLVGTNNSLGIWHTHIYPDVSWFIIIYHCMDVGWCWDVEVFRACLTLFNFTTIENWKLHLVWETNDLAMWYDIPPYQKTGDIRNASKQTWPFHLDTGLSRNRFSPKSNGLKPHCPLLFWELHLFRKRYHQNGSERLFCLVAVRMR